MTLWNRWAAWCFRPIDVVPAATTRALLAAIIVFDHVWVAVLGLRPLVFTPIAQGGMMPTKADGYLMGELFGPQGTTAAWALTIGAFSMVAAGIQTRVMTLVGLFAYAQLGVGGLLNDQGGDRIARTMLLILIFSAAQRSWPSRSRPLPSKMPAWPVDMMRFIFMLIYINAATCKLFPRPWKWLAGESTAVTYRIETYPMTSTLDAVTWFDSQWLFYFQDIATIVIELSAVLLFTRWRKWWGVLAAPIHIGILFTMSIGTFSFIMLALYPALVWDEWVVALRVRVQRMLGRS